MRFLGFFFFWEAAPVLQIYAQFTHNLKKTHSKRRETGPLGFRFPPFFICLFFPGTYAFFRKTASAMHWLAASSAWAIRWE